MTEFQLCRAVARATGESVDVIRETGFTILTPLNGKWDEADRWLHRRNCQGRHVNRDRRQHLHARGACAAV
jgi:hypothetical protein